MGTARALCLSSLPLPQEGYIKFLCELCVCEGQGILKNQSIICKLLLEENSGLLLTLAVIDGAVVVNVPADEEFGTMPATHGTHVEFRGKVRLSLGIRSVCYVICVLFMCRRTPICEVCIVWAMVTKWARPEL